MRQPRRGRWASGDADRRDGGSRDGRAQGRRAWAQGEFSTVTWASKNHTATKVGVYAVGPGAERFAEVHDNIDIHRVLRELTIAAEN